MSKMFTGSIDLNKIDKSKVVTVNKDGQPFQNGAKYLNVVVWVNDTPDQYGNDMSVQISQSKEERAAGEKAVYIGNLKEYVKDQQQAPIENQGAPIDSSDDLPF